MAAPSTAGGPSTDDLVAGWNLKDGGIGLAAIDLRDRRCLFSGAWIFVDDEHVQPQVFGVPVFVDDRYFLSAVLLPRDRLGIADTMDIHAFHLSVTQDLPL